MITEVNTLFQLRRDTLDKWETSSRVLRPGEAALAYTTVKSLNENGETVDLPVVLLKAGELDENTTKTFKDLPYVSALAADVPAWAKQDQLKVSFDGTGDVLIDAHWVNDTLIFTKGNVSSSELSWKTF